MLYELFTSLTTSCPQYVRHMDYLHEAIAMRARYHRNQQAWQSHLDESRQVILAAAEKCHDRRKAVVLGAGLLLDVPLDHLAGMFQELVLLDIVFLPEVVRKVKKYGNVKLVQHDVTNMAQKLYENIQHGRSDLPEAAPMIPEIDDATGFVVSLNILSQLWVMPRAYALKMLRGLDDEQMDDWCLQIVAAHYAFLRSLRCRVCLIADHEFIKRDSSGRIVSRGSTVRGLKLLEPEVSWTWNIAPRGEEQRHLSNELIVGAWSRHLEHQSHNHEPGKRG